MFENPSLMTRIAVGKIVGLIIGLIGFLSLPYFFAEADMLLRLGILFWYITLGAIIGVFGVMTEHPVLKLPLPWWFRSTILGAWMNFVLTFFAYDTMKTLLTGLFDQSGLLTSPFWFVLEGAIVGFVIGFFATKFGGEGKATVRA